MIYNFNITDDRIKLTGTSSAISGSVNCYKCVFSFSDAWNGLEKFAVFMRGDETYTLSIAENSCLIPSEILDSPSYITIGVYGSSLNSENFMRISTDFSHIVIKEGAYRDGTTPSVPQPDLWEEFFSRNLEIAREQTRDYIYKELGDAAKALDEIIALQNLIMGGETQ